MSLVIGFLTFILVVDCFLLMLLILIQLPKKEAGAGVAFGGAATDALFGAGSGNALTKMTKYTATLFLILAFSLSLMNSRQAQSGKRILDEELRKKAAASGQPMGSLSSSPNQALPASTQNLQNLPASTATNLTNAATTNQSVSLTSTNVAAVVPAQATNAPKPAITNTAATNSPAPAPAPAPPTKP
ncbi:MAG: preprotein translocase subunit SecG [Verrucomicrobia bacterium]|nr:preprotein translocase subunit SecG [Verrucomicrobiota bacterium]